MRSGSSKGLTYAHLPVPRLEKPRFVKRSGLRFHCFDIKGYFQDQFLCKVAEVLARSRIKGQKTGFPTKLSTEFVDKNIAL
jgi:hypothetical protein